MCSLWMAMVSPHKKMPLSKKRAFKSTADSYRASKKARVSTSTAAKVAKLVSAEEIKYYDTTSTVGTPVALSANVFGNQPCTAVGLGTGDSARIGRRVSPRYLEIRFSFYQAGSATNANIRLMVVLDTQNNGSATPLSTEVLEFAGVLAAPNSENKGRFKILMDECFQVNNTNSNTDYAVQTKYIDLQKVMSRIYSKPSDRFIWYNGDTAGASGTNGKNAIYFFWMSDVAIASSMATGTGRSGLDYYTRFAYTDA